MDFGKFFSILKPKNDFLKMKTYILRHTPLCSADIRCNSQKGLISVVLPVYNCEEYLTEAIHSVLTQTYTNLELIIVDDGSTDSSGQIADSFINKDKRVSVIHQKNMKLPAALNNGFDVAKGEFLTWTSADNRMLGSCLEILSDELTHDRSTDMVFGNMRLIDENGDILRGKGWYETPLFSGNVILPDSTELLNTHANNTIGAAFLYRAGAAAVLNGYSENRFFLEDYDYFMRMNSLFKIKHISYNKPIYEYRMHNKSLTSRDEELGITDSRPEMMEFDELRRSFYTKRIYFCADGYDKEIMKELCSSAEYISAKEEAEKLFSDPLPNIFYVNFGNCTPSINIPTHIPKFIVCSDAAKGTFGYDVMLCKNVSSFTKLKGRISPATPQAASSFMILRAKNDLLYNYEGNMR